MVDAKLWERIDKQIDGEKVEVVDSEDTAKQISADWINQDREKRNVILSDVDKIKASKLITNYYGKRDLAKQLLQVQPLYYDENKIWWGWNKEQFRWKIIDETDILLFVRELSFANTIKSKEKSEILEALKQEARLNKPQEVKQTWIQFKDLIVDVMSGEEFKAEPKYFVTNPIAYGIHKEKFIETPIMDKIFEEWVGKDYIKTLYEIIAYSLIPSYPIHRLFCLIGEGMNGKSCFLRLLTKFIGIENITSTELDTLLSSRFEITRLHKKLVCVMGETNFSELSKTSIIKKLTGGDLIGFEYKNKTPFEDKNYAKILIATNNLPTTTDKTIGFYRRWLIIDFPNSFSEQKDIIEDIPEEEFEILSVKSIKILKDLLDKRKFHNEGSIKERMKKYEDKSNFFDKFWEENIEEDYDSFISVSEFDRKLSIFCKNNKQRILSSKSIKEKMKENSIEQGKPYVEWWSNDKQIKRQIRAWMGIKWK